MTPQETPRLTSNATGGAERGDGGSDGLEAVTARSVTLAIPAPADWINTNRRYHHMAKAKLTKAWRQATNLAAKNLPPMQPPVHITATITKPRTGRYDPNNLADTTKACVDGLVDAGLIPDDSYKEVIGPDHRHGGKGPATLTLTITETRTP